MAHHGGVDLRRAESKDALGRVIFSGATGVKSFESQKLGVGQQYHEVRGWVSIQGLRRHDAIDQTCFTMLLCHRSQTPRRIALEWRLSHQVTKRMYGPQVYTNVQPLRFVWR